MEALRRLRPDDAVLSEEGKDDAERLEASRVWIVDPLDGTREYGEGRIDWAVHVALAVDGVPRRSAPSSLPGCRRRARHGRPAGRSRPTRPVDPCSSP